jgi:hypothetical protein
MHLACGLRAVIPITSRSIITSSVSILRPTMVDQQHAGMLVGWFCTLLHLIEATSSRSGLGQGRCALYVHAGMLLGQTVGSAGWWTK